MTNEPRTPPNLRQVNCEGCFNCKYRVGFDGFCCGKYGFVNVADLSVCDSYEEDDGEG
jgi:hypothetical protein